MFLAFHLNHGFQSAFQSLGLNNKKYAPMLKVVGSLFAFGFVGVGFASFPIIFMLGKTMHWDVLHWNMPIPGVH
jgi:succinate dehydrogenase / fumarate reductase cytochrome b subunit